MKWDDVDMDAVREVANIGAGNSSTALARIVGKKVMMDVPEVRIMEVERIPRLLKEYENERCMGVLIDFRGDINGKFVHIIPHSMKMALGKAVLKVESSSLIDSAINEITNIIIGNYLSAVSRMLKMRVIHYPPNSAEDNVYALIDGVLGEMALMDETVFVFNNVFKIEEVNLKSFLMMLMFKEDAERFLDRIKSI